VAIVYCLRNSGCCSVVVGEVLPFVVVGGPAGAVVTVSGEVLSSIVVAGPAAAVVVLDSKTRHTSVVGSSCNSTGCFHYLKRSTVSCQYTRMVEVVVLWIGNGSRR